MTTVAFVTAGRADRHHKAIFHFQQMTNTYQSMRVYAGSFAGQLYDAYLGHRSAAERFGSIHKRTYVVQHSFPSVWKAQGFALSFEATFPFVPIEIHGYGPSESPYLVVWARLSDFQAIERFIKDNLPAE